MKNSDTGMRIIRSLTAFAGVSAGLLMLSGCETAPPAAPQKNQTAQGATVPLNPPMEQPLPASPHRAARSAADLRHSKTPIRDAVEDAMDQRPEMFPKNTEILGINLTDGVATIDFSREFNKLTEMGDSNEGDVQRLLRSSLAQVKDVDRMRVTVDGHRFESQNTDWYTPFSVHLDQGDLQPVSDFQPAQPQSKTRKRQNSTPISPVGKIKIETPKDTIKIPAELLSDNTPKQLKNR